MKSLLRFFEKWNPLLVGAASTLIPILGLYWTIRAGNFEKDNLFLQDENLSLKKQLQETKTVEARIRCQVPDDYDEFF